METNLDDMSPEGWQWVEAKLFEAGALDVWRETIAMKKGRMGFCLKVLCEENQRDQIQTVIFTETSGIGLRSYVVEKSEMTRDYRIHEINSCKIQIKRAHFNGEPLKYKAEYEDVVNFAKAKGLTLIEANRRIQRDLEEDEKWKWL